MSIVDRYKKVRTVNMFTDGKSYYKNKYSIPYDGKSYKEINVVQNSIYGTAFAVVSTLETYIPTRLYTCIKGIVTDGYFMVLLSPFFLLYWLMITIILSPMLILIALTTLLAILITMIFEMPASFVNGENYEEPSYIPEKDNK